MVTEPRAVATGPLIVEEVSMRIVEEVSTRQQAGRYRSRFCNDRVALLQPTRPFDYSLRRNTPT